MTDRERELEAQLEEFTANSQLQYTEAWHAYTRILKRMGAAVGIELPPDLRYYKYENLIVARIAALREKP